MGVFDKGVLTPADLNITPDSPEAAVRLVEPQLAAGAVWAGLVWGEGVGGWPPLLLSSAG